MAAKQKSRPWVSHEAEPVYGPPVAGAPVAVTSAPVSVKPWRLNLVAFVAGAVLMGLEIVGSRLLAPHFGNSVFVWGSLISLFLIALSAGYYLGGRLADRYPSLRLLTSILLVVAASLIAIAGIARPVCQAFVLQGFGEKSGPFFASAVLFLLPSIGMGIVSPFAVRLATHTVASVGTTAGTLYALSTIGSIAGTMVTTFVLIPNIGAGAILKVLAAALAAAALAAFPFVSQKTAGIGTAIAILVGSAAAYAVNPTRIFLPLGSKLLVDVDTPYHHIAVVDSPDGSRQLRFDQFVESAVQIEPPHESLSDYTRYFHLAFLPRREIRRTLFIGAGGGVGPRSFHMHDPTMEIEVVDIDPKVLELAQSHFFLEHAAQIRTIAADGRAYVRAAPSGAYDAILLDAFSIGGRIPFHLVTREFIAMCRDRLKPGGVFIMNINSALKGPNAQIFRSMYKTIDAAFEQNAHVFELGRMYGRPELSTNIMLVGINSQKRPTHDDWAEWATRYESNSYIGRDQIERMLDDLVVTLPDVSEAPLFTDDYAPIETMPF